MPDGWEGMWPEAQLDEPATDEERRRYREMYESAEWSPRSDMGAALSPEMERVEREIVGGKKFLSKWDLRVGVGDVERGFADRLVCSA